MLRAKHSVVAWVFATRRHGSEKDDHQRESNLPAHRASPTLERLLSWLEQGFLRSEHFLSDAFGAVQSEMLRYRRRWVDFADACIVTLSDRHPKLPVATVDGRDFSLHFSRRAEHRLLVPPRY